MSAVIPHGVPSFEVADAPATRELVAAAAPAPAEVAAAVDALRAASVLRGRAPELAARPNTALT